MLLTLLHKSNLFLDVGMASVKRSELPRGKLGKCYQWKSLHLAAPAAVQDLPAPAQHGAGLAGNSPQLVAMPHARLAPWLLQAAGDRSEQCKKKKEDSNINKGVERISLKGFQLLARTNTSRFTRFIL